MSLINCKNCGKEVSDKATKCPSCGAILIADLSEEIETKIDRPVAHCKDCGQELPEDATICPNCGCPVETVESPISISDTVDNQKVPDKKNKKKGIIIGAIAAVAVVICIVVGLIISSNNHKKAIKEYSSNLSSASYTMLSGAAITETAGNLIKNVWHDCIYEEFDLDTVYYVKDDNGKYFDDFNDALRKLFDDESFQDLISGIKNNQESVNELMKKLQNPPKEYEEAYEMIKEYYQAYLNFTGLVISPNGSLTSFSSDINDADNETIRLYNSMKLYIDDEVT